jgi:DnaJ family protein B protein 6
MDEDTCLYAILGVDRNASAVEIRRAYRRLALEYHPDRNEHGAETFKLVSRAYETLSDTERRNAYDVATGHGFRGGWMDDDDDDVDVTTTRGWRGNAGSGGATRTFYRDPFDLFRDVFGDDFGTFVGGGMMPRDPFADFGRRGGASSSMFGGGGIGGFGFDDEFDDGFGGFGGAGSRSSSMFGGTGGGFGGFGGGGLMGMMSGGSAGGGSSMSASFHTGFGGGGHAQTWSSSTSTTTTIGPDGTRRTRTVTRRTLPDGTIVESEDVSEGGIGTIPGSRHSIGGSSGGRFLRDW